MSSACTPDQHQGSRQFRSQTLHERVYILCDNHCVMLVWERTPCRNNHNNQYYMNLKYLVTSIWINRIEAESRDQAPINLLTNARMRRKILYSFDPPGAATPQDMATSDSDSDAINEDLTPMECRTCLGVCPSLCVIVRFQFARSYVTYIKMGIQGPHFGFFFHSCSRRNRGRALKMSLKDSMR